MKSATLITAVIAGIGVGILGGIATNPVMKPLPGSDWREKYRAMAAAQWDDPKPIAEYFSPPEWLFGPRGIGLAPYDPVPLPKSDDSAAEAQAAALEARKAVEAAPVAEPALADGRAAVDHALVVTQDIVAQPETAASPAPEAAGDAPQADEESQHGPKVVVFQ